MTGVIGFREEEARKLLEARGQKVVILEYGSRKGVEGADSARVIRQRPAGINTAELTVSRFKTRI